MLLPLILVSVIAIGAILAVVGIILDTTLYRDFAGMVTVGCWIVIVTGLLSLILYLVRAWIYTFTGSFPY